MTARLAAPLAILAAAGLAAAVVLPHLSGIPLEQLAGIIIVVLGMA